MTFRIRELFGCIFSIFRKRKLDDDFNEEIASHIDMATEENIRAGMGPQEARRQAVIRFGGIEAAREQHRDARGLPLIENIALDVRYAFRMFRKNPGFSLAVIITLALCVGANTAIYSMLDALIFKPLPFHESDRIFVIYNKDSVNAANSDKDASNIPQYLDFKENTDAFSHLALWQTRGFNLIIGDEDVRAAGAVATAEIFDVLGLTPLLGRFFSKENNRFADNREVVLTQLFWESHFQEDPGVIDRTIQVNREVFTIVGIAPKTIEYFNALPQLIVSMRWTPQQADPENRYVYGPSTLLGRLKPDATIGAVTAQMTALERHAFDIAPPSTQEDMDRNDLVIGVETLQSYRVEPDLRLKLYLLQGAVLFVLLIGCVNVTNLFLSRSNARQGELAVRIALGSGRRAITRQLIAESFMLTWLGTVLGIALAIGIIEIINIFTAQFLPEFLPFVINDRLLTFTAIIAILISLAIGLFQVFHVFGSNLLTLIRNQSGRTSDNRSLRTISGGLVVAQIAITLILLIGGGLLIHSFAKLLAVDPGFNSQNLLAARIDLPPDYLQNNHDQKFRRQLEERLREIPGFTSVSLSALTPCLTGITIYGSFKLQDHERLKGETDSNAMYFCADPSYLETMQIPLIEGRWFNNGDNSKSRPVCVVNQDFIREYASGRGLVGKRLTFNDNEPTEDWPEIVGVVGSVHNLRLEEEYGRTSLPAIYYPVQQNLFPLWTGTSVLIRSPRPASEVTALLRKKVKEIDPALPLIRTRLMEHIISSSLNERRAIMLLLCSFAGIALILSAVGIYGVLAYDVSKRTHEIGIRGAIGATNKQIVTMVLRQGLWKAGIGLLIGMAGAFYLSRFMTSLLFEVKPIDPLTFVLVPVLLLVVALLASYIPARQASKVEPARALRTE